MTVTTEKNGPVTTVILSRPEARNAVDPATAAELVAAFEAFEADDGARVGVFFGDHGVFCAGMDLKTLAGGGDWRDWVRFAGSIAPWGRHEWLSRNPLSPRWRDLPLRAALNLRFGAIFVSSRKTRFSACSAAVGACRSIARGNGSASSPYRPRPRARHDFLRGVP